MRFNREKYKHKHAYIRTLMSMYFNFTSQNSPDIYYNISHRKPFNFQSWMRNVKILTSLNKAAASFVNT